MVGLAGKGVLDRTAGAEGARDWRDLAERALIAFGGNPLPQGRGDGGGGSGWWGGLQPLTPPERSMANVSGGGVRVVVAPGCGRWCWCCDDAYILLCAGSLVCLF